MRLVEGGDETQLMHRCTQREKATVVEDGRRVAMKELHCIADPPKAKRVPVDELRRCNTLVLRDDVRRDHPIEQINETRTSPELLVQSVEEPLHPNPYRGALRHDVKITCDTDQALWRADSLVDQEQDGNHGDERLAVVNVVAAP